MRPFSPIADPADLPLGVILAGGASTRFGSPKALARLGGRTIIERARNVLGRVVPDPVVIANDPALVAGLDLPARPDRVSGHGPLSGLHAALHWAAQRGRRGVLCVACDMPFLSAGLLARILERSRETSALGVVPASGSRHGFEPLCAWYHPEVLGEIERRLRRAPAPLGSLGDTLDLEVIPPAAVRAFGDPGILFLNVNRMSDLETAAQIARREDEG